MSAIVRVDKPVENGDEILDGALFYVVFEEQITVNFEISSQNLSHRYISCKIRIYMSCGNSIARN